MTEQVLLAWAKPKRAVTAGTRLPVSDSVGH
jgi:hypothetical protein